MANILVVDDQRCVRELVREELVSEGYEVFGLPDPASVISYLKFRVPDLVLLDLCLDGFEGIDLLADIKKRNPHLPVIAFTAYDTYTEDPRLSQADGYVIKSMVLDELKEKIAGVLEKKQAMEGAAERGPRFEKPCTAHAF